MSANAPFYFAVRIPRIDGPAQYQAAADAIRTALTVTGGEIFTTTDGRKIFADAEGYKFIVTTNCATSEAQAMWEQIVIDSVIL